MHFWGAPRDPRDPALGGTGVTGAALFCINPLYMRAREKTLPHAMSDGASLPITMNRMKNARKPLVRFRAGVMNLSIAIILRQEIGLVPIRDLET